MHSRVLICYIQKIYGAHKKNILRDLFWQLPPHGLSERTARPRARQLEQSDGRRDKVLDADQDDGRRILPSTIFVHRGSHGWH
jgi:hypothetical protein